MNTDCPCPQDRGQAKHSGDISVGEQTWSTAPNRNNQSGPSVANVSGPERITKYFRRASSISQKDQDEFTSQLSPERIDNLEKRRKS